MSIIARYAGGKLVSDLLRKVIAAVVTIQDNVGPTTIRSVYPNSAVQLICTAATNGSTCASAADWFVINPGMSTGTISLSFTTGYGSPVAVTANYIRNANVVTLVVPSVIGTIGGSSTVSLATTASLPTFLTPASSVYGQMETTNAAVAYETGTFTVSTSGLITAFRGANESDTWSSGSGNSGFYGFSLAYTAN